MEVHRIPLESTKKAEEEARRKQEEAEAAILAAKAAERREKEMRIYKVRSYSESDWKKLKTKRKLANKSRTRNRR